MYDTVYFNIYEEKLEDIVFKNDENRTSPEGGDEKQDENSGTTDRPIPKPVPEYWTSPLNYGRVRRKDEGRFF